VFEIVYPRALETPRRRPAKLLSEDERRVYAPALFNHLPRLFRVDGDERRSTPNRVPGSSEANFQRYLHTSRQAEVVQPG